jgi:hypothetical protein
MPFIYAASQLPLFMHSPAARQFSLFRHQYEPPFQGTAILFLVSPTTTLFDVPVRINADIDCVGDGGYGVTSRRLQATGKGHENGRNRGIEGLDPILRVPSSGRMDGPSPPQ